MTVEDVLKADWNIVEIEVTVREPEHLGYIKRYHIGKDVRPGRTWSFVRTSKAGDVYKNGAGLEEIYIRKTIQFGQLKEKPRGKEICRGVLLKEIPKQIRGLEIYSMSPSARMSSEDEKLYRFSCVTDEWHGIKGEDETVEEEEI